MFWRVPQTFLMRTHSALRLLLSSPGASKLLAVKRTQPAAEVVGGDAIGRAEMATNPIARKELMMTRDNGGFPYERAVRGRHHVAVRTASLRLSQLTGDVGSGRDKYTSRALYVSATWYERRPIGKWEE